MPSIGNIEISSITSSDGASTSATVATDATLKPEGFVLPGVARWVDRSGGIEIGYPSLDFTVRKPVKNISGERMFKITANLRLPILEVTSPSTMSGIQPAPTLAYALMGKVEFNLPARSTKAERQKILSYARSILLGGILASDGTPAISTLSPIIAAVEDFEAVY